MFWNVYLIHALPFTHSSELSCVKYTIVICTIEISVLLMHYRVYISVNKIIAMFLLRKNILSMLTATLWEALCARTHILHGFALQ